MSNITEIVEYVKNNNLEKVKSCIEKDNSLVDARDEESKFRIFRHCKNFNRKRSEFKRQKPNGNNRFNVRMRRKTN